MDEHFVVGIHVLAVVVELGGAAVDDGRPLFLNDVFHSVGSGIAVGGAGIAKDHGIVAWLDTIEIDGQILLGLHGLVVGGIFGRIAILVDIHTENVEVAFVTRPSPVVGVGAELADAPWRTAYETHVGVFVIFKENVLVAAVERNDFYTNLTFTLAVFLDLTDVLVNQLTAFCLGGFIGDTL